MSSTDHRRRSRWAVLAGAGAALLLTVVVIVLLPRRHGHEPAALAAAERSTQAQAGALQVDDAAMLATAAARPVTATAGTPSAASAPAVDLTRPAAELLQTLGPRARAGDAHAACDLSRAMLRCQFMRDWIDQPPPREPPAQAGAEALDAYIERRARQEDMAGQYQRRCAGLSDRDYHESARFLLTAARGGYLPAIYEFAMLPLQDHAALIRDPMLANAYRSELWPMFRRGLATGDRDFVQAFAVSVLRRDMPLTAALPERYQQRDAARAFLARFANPESRARLFDGIAPPSADVEQTVDQWLDELVTQPPTPGRVSTGGVTLNYGAADLDADEGCRDTLWLH